jgi:hypothetical protein
VGDDLDRTTVDVFPFFVLLASAILDLGGETTTLVFNAGTLGRTAVGLAALLLVTAPCLDSNGPCRKSKLLGDSDDRVAGFAVELTGIVFEIFAASCLDEMTEAVGRPEAIGSGALDESSVRGADDALSLDAVPGLATLMAA